MFKENEGLPREEEKSEPEIIMEMAACGFTPANIAKSLGYEVSVFLNKWKDERSIIREAYEDGKLLSDFTVLNKQRELAESGNITAAQIFIKEKRDKEIANIRDKILRDDA